LINAVLHVIDTERGDENDMPGESQP